MTAVGNASEDTLLRLADGTVNRVARTVHLPSTVLANDGTYTNQDPYAIPVGVKAVTFYTSYTRGVAGGFPLYRVLVGNGTEERDIALVDPVIVVAQPFGTQLSYKQVISGSVNATDAVDGQAFTIPILGGETTIRMLMAEADATKATPGTGAIALTAGY